MHLDIHIEKEEIEELEIVMAEMREMKSKAFVIWGHKRHVWY